ncbi:MAG TPA: virulence-associated E family protein [Rhizomicrobium sp.]|jgi:hypothetical protein
MTEKIDNPIPVPDSVEEAPAPSMFNDARLLTPFNPDDYRDHPFKWMYGPNKESRNWKLDTQTPDVATMFLRLSEHREDKNKDGLAFVTGEMAPGQRLKTAVKALYAIGLDFDKGTPPEKIDAAMVALGCACIRYTTHSNGKTHDDFKRDEVVKWWTKDLGEDAENIEIDTDLMRRYLLEKKGWDAGHVKTAEFIDVEHRNKGIVVNISMNPMSKNRVVIPLAVPFVIADADVAPTQQEAIAKWAKVPPAMADLMGLGAALDMTGTDTSRLFYFPRHARNMPWEITICGGDLFDWRTLELDNPYDKLAQEGRSGGSKSKTREGQDLASWSRTHAGGFQIADLLRDRAPERIRGNGSSGPEIVCPFDDGHSNPGDPDDRACMAVNAGDSSAPVYSIKCQHDSCRDYTNLDMLARMIADGWFPRELIDSDDYNAVMGDGHATPATGNEIVVADGYGGALAINDDLPAPPKGVTYDKKTGQIHPTYRNALILIGTEYWDLGYNELSQTYGLRGEVAYPWPAHLGYALNDAIRREIRLYLLRKWGVTFKPEDIYEATMTLARRNTFNPVCDYLNEVEAQWDGTPRVENWLERYLGVKVTDNFNAAYVRAIGKIVLVAAVRRARKPGTKFDEMLTLEGPQGGNKSSAVGVLGGEWYSDAKLGDLANTQKVGMKLSGTWIHEFGELVGLTKAEVEEVKAFLSTLRDRYKQPYGRSEDYYPRRCIFIGTVNPGGGAYLTDLTGNRRFWPVVCGEIDLAALERDRDQLWAEAATMESRGDSIRLDPSLYAAAKTEQDARLADDPWVERLADYLEGQRANGKTRVLSMTLLSDEDALNLHPDKQTQAATKKLKAAMALIPTWEYKASVRADGVKSAGYEYVGT